MKKILKYFLCVVMTAAFLMTAFSSADKKSDIKYTNIQLAAKSHGSHHSSGGHSSGGSSSGSKSHNSGSGVESSGGSSHNSDGSEGSSQKGENSDSVHTSSEDDNSDTDSTSDNNGTSFFHNRHHYNRHNSSGSSEGNYSFFTIIITQIICTFIFAMPGLIISGIIALVKKLKRTPGSVQKKYKFFSNGLKIGILPSAWLMYIADDEFFLEIPLLITVYMLYLLIKHLVQRNKKSKIPKNNDILEKKTI